MAEGSVKAKQLEMEPRLGENLGGGGEATAHCIGEAAFTDEAPPGIVMLGDARGSMGGSFISTMDNSLASTTKRGSSKKAKKRLSAEKKLEEINAQLAAVRKEREETTAKKTGRVLGKRTDYSKRPKKSFHHPNLEYVMGELIYSPYRTHPLATYPDETFRMSEKLKDLRRTGQKYEELADEQKPYDLQKVRKSFVSEIANYNPGFNVKARNIEPPLPGQRRVRSMYVLDDNQSVATASVTTNEPKSLQRHMAEFRGGPQKFKQQLPPELRSKRMHASARSLDGSKRGMTGSDTAAALKRFQEDYPLKFLLAEPSGVPRETTLSPKERNRGSHSRQGSITSERARTTSPQQSGKVHTRGRLSHSSNSAHRRSTDSAEPPADGSTVDYTGIAAAVAAKLTEDDGVEYGERVGADDEYNDETFEADMKAEGSSISSDGMKTNKKQINNSVKEKGQHSGSCSDNNVSSNKVGPVDTPQKPSGPPGAMNTPTRSGKSKKLSTTPMAPPPAARAPPITAETPHASDAAVTSETATKASSSVYATEVTTKEQMDENEDKKYDVADDSFEDEGADAVEDSMEQIDLTHPPHHGDDQQHRVTARDNYVRSPVSGRPDDADEIEEEDGI